MEVDDLNQGAVRQRRPAHLRMHVNPTHRQRDGEHGCITYIHMQRGVWLLAVGQRGSPIAWREPEIRRPPACAFHGRAPAPRRHPGLCADCRRTCGRRGSSAPPPWAAAWGACRGLGKGTDALSGLRFVSVLPPAAPLAGWHTPAPHALAPPSHLDALRVCWVSLSVCVAPAPMGNLCPSRRTERRPGVRTPHRRWGSARGCLLLRVAARLEYLSGVAGLKYETSACSVTTVCVPPDRVRSSPGSLGAHNKIHVPNPHRPRVAA